MGISFIRPRRAGPIMATRLMRHYLSAPPRMAKAAVTRWLTWLSSIRSRFQRFQLVTTSCAGAGTPSNPRKFGPAAPTSALSTSTSLCDVVVQREVFGGADPLIAHGFARDGSLVSMALHVRDS